MKTCKISTYLAYAMLIYCISSIYYLLRTRQIGTPFHDSLSLEQLQIKAKSANTRRNIFLQGLAVGLLVIVVLRPFKNCK